mmetsp:Transcript_25723/g.51483  ORF Transcript_25723/g.51483 Transcript_25723/m.51483 type:complete len:680 (+) Transcript_25723:225-2264(+)
MSSLSSVAASFICRRRHYLSARSIFFQKLAQPRFVSSLCSSNFGTQYNGPENRGHPISYHGPSTPYHGPVPGTLLPNGHGKNNFHHCFSSAAAAIEEDDHDQLLPTHHSRKLPPAVCPPSLLRSEVEAIFDAPVGSLIVYDSKSSSSNANELKSVQEELSDVYYAADEAVQRVEYILRGLNAVVSEGSFVSRALGVGDMTLEGQDDASSGGGGEGMSKNDAFRAMLDLIDRMEAEGSAYAELRKRVRSQLTLAGGADDGESSDSSSSSSSSSDDDDDDDDESSFNEFANEMESRMAKAGFASSKPQSEYSTAKAANPVAVEHNPEEYQFGADPGTTTHMYDLLLDAMACIVHEQYSGSMTSKSSTSSSEDIMEIMGEDIPPPPAMAKSILQKVLHRHWLDGGDIGFGVAGDDGNDFFKPAQGVGTGAGTGAGNLAKITPRTSFDVRTCPTPMTFNAVLRVAAEFDPAAHASAVENAQILRGNKGKRNGLLDIQQEQERLRDITLDAAFSTYSQMKTCAALTLRSISKSSLNATSRSALKRQAKLLAPGSNADHKSKFNAITSGRNSATYAYMLRTISNCIPPSLSRGNIAFGLYHKACVQEGVMDEILVKAMRNVGGYEDNEDVAENTFSPPVVNGPLFDSFMEKELRFGWTAALDKGRKLRQDRNYKLRRFVEWDDTY